MLGTTQSSRPDGIKLLRKIKNMGDVLNDKERELGHKKWGQFLEQNFDGTRRSANRYRLISRFWEVLLPRINSGDIQNYKQALAYLKLQGCSLRD